MFADVVQRVYRTRIFSAMESVEQQILVYDARVATKVRNAMILPIPTRPGTQAAIELVDLSGYASFFDTLSSMFEEAVSAAMPCATPAQSVLAVVRVGAFEASIVPTVDDLSRLDRRFSFAGESFLPWRRKRGLLDVVRDRYADHAFVVYQIAKGESHLHPFGLRFKTRYQSLFFPTLHVHDGDAPAQTPFDHELYAQRASFLSEEMERTGQPFWEVARNERSTLPARGSLPSFVDSRSPVIRMQVGGLLPNQDTFARAVG